MQIKTKKITEEKVVKFVSYFVLTVFTLIALIPILYILQLTFSTSADAGFRIFPKGFILQHYQYIFENDMIQRPFLNSLIVTVCSPVVSMVLMVGIAYPLSRKELVGRKVLNFAVILPMLLSLGFLPEYLLVKNSGLMDSLSSSIFPVAMNTFNIIVMRNFLETIPDSLTESARTDGCSEMKILLKTVPPLSTVVLATVTLSYMVAFWNSYLDVILYINDPQKHILQVVLRTLVMENSTDLSSADLALSKNVQYTMIVAALLLVMIIYPFLQKYFVKGIMIGSAKG